MKIAKKVSIPQKMICDKDSPKNRHLRVIEMRAIVHYDRTVELGCSVNPRLLKLLISLAISTSPPT